MGQNIAGKAYDRLTTGDYLPLQPTRPNRFGKVWFAIPGGIVAIYVMAYLSATYPDSETLAYFMSGLILVGVLYAMVAIGKAVLPRTISGTTAVARGGRHAAQRTGRTLQDHGWPSWRDAWGEKGMRPGGALRGLARGILRTFAILWVLALLTVPMDGGAILAMWTIAGGFFAFGAAFMLYQARVYDFSLAKGIAFSAFLWAFIDAMPFGNERKQAPPSFPDMPSRWGPPPGQ